VNSFALATPKAGFSSLELLHHLFLIVEHVGRLLRDALSAKL
jgi:hypothetical protein